MRHTLTRKRAQAPRRAHRLLDASTGFAVYLLDASTGFAVYHGSTHISTICVGDGSYSVYTVARKLIGSFSSYSEALRAIPSRGRA